MTYSSRKDTHQHSSTPGTRGENVAEAESPSESERSSSSSSLKRKRSPASHERRSASPHSDRSSSPDVPSRERSRSQPSSPQESVPPPLPSEPEPAPQQEADDGWQPVWDDTAGAYYFYNRLTQATQWDNPRVSIPIETQPVGNDRVVGAPGTSAPGIAHSVVRGGYNPAIHGDYDPNADYAQEATETTTSSAPPSYDPVTGAVVDATALADGDQYAATAQFNRFTGRFSNSAIHPTHTTEAHTDAAKSKRQMDAFFDVDVMANKNDGKSLRAERAGKKLSKSEIKAFKEKRRTKKEEKRRAWLKD